MDLGTVRGSGVIELLDETPAPVDIVDVPTQVDEPTATEDVTVEHVDELVEV